MAIHSTARQCATYDLIYYIIVKTGVFIAV